MARLQIHPACKLFPPLSEDDLQALADDIAANGLRNPIVLHDGKILDGRNRHEACRIAGVEPDFAEFDGGDPIAWVVSQNLVRRHLTASQRAVLALDLLPLLEREAKERQRLSQGRGKRGGKSSVPYSLNGEAAEIAARMTRSNAKYVRAVKQIREKAPELIEKVRSGEINIPDAEKLAAVPEERRRRLIESANGNGGDVFRHWKEPPPDRAVKPSRRSAAERAKRVAATTLIHGDCQTHLENLPDRSIDLVVSDPPYPEVRPRGDSYPRIDEDEWHEVMRKVIVHCRRILKPQGSAVFILQPNARVMGEMRIWLWEFLVWAAREWNLVEDVYWWNYRAIPTRGAKREFGLLRPSIKMCIWLGSPDCYRNQNGVLWTPSESADAQRRSDMAMRVSPSGRSVRRATITQSIHDRGGSTPFNLIPVAAQNDPASGDHPATTPYDLAAWWCRYLLPPGGVLLDAFCGSGTMLQAGLDCGASKVIGIEKERKYLETARRRIRDG